MTKAPKFITCLDGNYRIRVGTFHFHMNIVITNLEWFESPFCQPKHNLFESLLINIISSQKHKCTDTVLLGKIAAI